MYQLKIIAKTNVLFILKNLQELIINRILNEKMDRKNVIFDWGYNKIFEVFQKISQIV